MTILRLKFFCNFLPSEILVQSRMSLLHVLNKEVLGTKNLILLKAIKNRSGNPTLQKLSVWFARTNG